MGKPRLSLLTAEEIESIHKASIHILNQTGLVVHNSRVMNILAQSGAKVEFGRKRVFFPENLIEQSLQSAGKKFTMYGRNPEKIARFGYGDHNMISSPGQYGWFDTENETRRDPLLSDALLAITLGDSLDNISIVGSMAVPVDVPPAARDVVVVAELVKHTTKPTRYFPVSPQSTRYVMEIYKAVAGGTSQLKEKPMTEFFVEPISPLQLPDIQLDILQVFLDYGQPASIGPMAMAAGTAPATLAGTLAQENAEILAALVVIQLLSPGTPILYGGIPHIMDPKTSICSFGSPEQSILALGMAEMGKHYGFPVYVNVNLTDSKELDIQAGMEKMGSLISGMLAGADLFGHAGIVGTDHGGSLLWLAADNEAVQYAKRVARGLTINEDTLAEKTIQEVGPGGNYLGNKHTVRQFRKELWLPSSLWSRDSFDSWIKHNGGDMKKRLKEYVYETLSTHKPEQIDSHLEAEINRIVKSAIKELVGLE